MDMPKGPVTGYLLIKTRNFPEREYISMDPCDEKYQDPKVRIACKIKEILDKYTQSGRSAVPGPYRGAIVVSDEPQLNIIVSFNAKDENTFSAIADEIRKLSALGSEEIVTDVTKAISTNDRLDGFQGPP